MSTNSSQISQISICIIDKDTYNEFILTLSSAKFTEKEEDAPNEVSKMEFLANMTNGPKDLYLN